MSINVRQRIKHLLSKRARPGRSHVLSALHRQGPEQAPQWRQAAGRGWGRGMAGGYSVGTGFSWLTKAFGAGEVEEVNIGDTPNAPGLYA